MSEKDIRIAEILAFLASIPVNYYLFGWYITIVVTAAIFISDYVVNKINKL